MLRAATDLVCVLAQLKGDCEFSGPLARGGLDAIELLPYFGGS